MSTYHKVAQQNGNSHLADGRDVESRLLLDSGSVKVLEGRKVDAGSSIANQFRRYLERLGRNTANDDITQWQAVLELPALLVLHLVAGLLDALTTGEELHARDINRVDVRAVVGQKSGERLAVHLGTVDDGDGLSEQAVARSEEGVVDLEILEDLDDRKGCARKNGLETVVWRIQEANIVVHVFEVCVPHALHVFAEGYSFPNVLIEVRVIENRIVYHHTVHVIVLVGGFDVLLQLVFLYCADFKLKSTARIDQLMSLKVFASFAESTGSILVLACLLGVLGIRPSRRIVVCQESYKCRWPRPDLLELREVLLDISEKTLRDGLCGDDATGLGHSRAGHS